MHILSRCILSAAALTVSASAVAALPNPGLWAINGELTGKPGRGIQIDRQDGETVIASYYGYREDGSAVFYQAVGKITDGKTFNADLIEYKGGTVIGGTVKDATEAKTIGPIQAVFSTDTSGSVTLPGSEPKAFSRYVYEDHRARLNNTFEVMWVTPSNLYHPIKQIFMSFQASENKLTVSYNDPTDGDLCSFQGDLKADGSGFVSSGSIGCSTVLGVGTPRRDRIENLKIDERGILTGTLHTHYDRPEVHAKTTLLGMCVENIDIVIAAPPSPSIYSCSPSRLGLSTTPE